MPTINQLPTLTDASSGDQLAVFNTVNGDARKMSLNTLLQFFQANFASPTMTVQFVTPGTGFNVAVASSAQNTWMLIQPAGTLAAGTVTLPLATSAHDGLEVLITTTQQITAFTLGLNGAAASYGDPTTLAAEDNFRMRYYSATNSWYKVA